MIDLAIREGVNEDEVEDLEAAIFKIRPFGSQEKGRQASARIQAGLARPEDRNVGVNMRDLGPADIDKLVTIKGLIIRATPIIPDMKTGQQLFYLVLAHADVASSLLSLPRLPQHAHR